MRRVLGVVVFLAAVSGCYRRYGKTYSIFEKAERSHRPAPINTAPPPPKQYIVTLDVQVLEACNLIEKAAVGAQLLLVSRTTNQVVFSRAADANGRFGVIGKFWAQEAEDLVVLIEGRKVQQVQANELSDPGIVAELRIPCRPSGKDIKPPELPKPGSYLRSTPLGADIEQP